jgi:FkbM family methyltransferase
MKRQGQWLKKILFRILSFDKYLLVISKIYFVSFNLGLLKKSKLYEYPYFLKKVIRKGDVIIDIGANLGYLTVLFAKLAGNEGEVHAVEPVKPVIKILERHTKRLTNVQIHPYALGKENKKIVLGNNTRQKLGFIATGSHFILDENITEEEHAQTEFEAEMRQGSKLFSKLDKLDFIKIDVEGYETVILPEMADLISRHKPIMLIETRREKRREIMGFLSRMNYKMYVLHNGSLKCTSENEYWDILCTHTDKLERLSPYIL